MANIIDQRLDELAAALADVLPGRATSTPRTEEVGFSMWIEVPSLTPDRVPNARQVNADFPVVITADGADRAQVAFLNDAVAKVWDACTRLRHAWAISSRPQSTAPGTPHTVVVTVRMLLAGSGFCLPDDPGAVVVPPEPIDPITPDPVED